MSHRLQAAWLSRGPMALLLLPVSLLYGALASVRNALYAFGLLRTITLPVPVVVVGNLVAGGAGKTPTVIAIVGRLRRRGYTPGIVSRGHGGSHQGLVDVLPDTPAARCGDEPLLLRLRTGAPVMVGRDRVAAARALLDAHPSVDLIVSDDGLQHRRLGRHVQVLVFDERGVGNGWWLPAGPLRDRLPRRLPANTLVLYNADIATTPLPGHVAARSLGGVVGLADWWTGRSPNRGALDALKGRRIVAAAGTARPQRFFTMLRASGLQVEPLALPDHHDFHTLPWPPDTSDVIVTEKDAVKLAPTRMGATRVWVAALDFDTGPAFADALAAMLPSPPPDTVRSTESAHGSPTA